MTYGLAYLCGIYILENVLERAILFFMSLRLQKLLHCQERAMQLSNTIAITPPHNSPGAIGGLGVDLMQLDGFL